jgi:protein-disulfide isomerase
MTRRFLVMLLRRCILLLGLVCLGCSAQSVPSDLSVRIERQVRSYYNVPSDVSITVDPQKPSEFLNYNSVTVHFQSSSKNRSYDFLVSADGKTLIRMTKLDLTKDPNAEVMKKIDTQGRPTRGDKDAKVVVVNYDDFECPFCSRMHQTLFPELLKEYGDRVEFIYKDFPLLEIHPWAMHAAVDANCLAAQSSDAYWDFADYLHSNQKAINGAKEHDGQFAELDHLALLQGQQHKLDPAKLQGCVTAQNDDAIKASLKEGEALGVEATPTLFVNGEKIDGARPVDDVRAALDRALQQAGVPVPSHSKTSTGSAPVSGK